MDYDVVIVGAGFGGAVMAARLGEHLQALGKGHSVLVLDRGIDPTGKFDPEAAGELNAQGNRFRHSLDPSYLAQFTQIFTDNPGLVETGAASMNVVAGSGLGGGSLIYDGVSLRAPAMIFEQQQDGRRLWPAIYTRTALEPYFDRASQELSVHRLAWTSAEAPHWQLATKRDFVFAEGCRRIGATALPLKLADKDDANEGWWNSGQRLSGRQDLSKNYLAKARAAGVSFKTGVDVENVAPNGTGYAVSGTARDGKPFAVECKLLIVAAGAVASSGLLLRSRGHFTGDRSLELGGQLGKHLSSNGDYGVTGIVSDEFHVEGHKGKPMSSFCPSFWPQHQFILIPFYAAPLHLALGQVSTLTKPDDALALGRRSTQPREVSGRAEREWGLEYKQLLKSFGTRLLTMGCLALDASEGEVVLDDDERTVGVRWSSTEPSTEARWNAAVDTMRRIYEGLGGEMFLDNYRKDGTVNTSHPLGGCRMATEPEHGIVNEHGEHHRNPNLFVIDGAIIPSALGVNPSLTIAAVAESIADRLIKGENTSGIAARLG
ncbi:MAG: GMC family oxidoreductase [Polyangiaceae bacterium]